MAIYYLKSNGGDVSPYDSELNAATSMWSIRALPGFASTDIIILCDDVTEVVHNPTHMNKMCNIVAKEGLSTRPKYHYNIVNGYSCIGSTEVPTTISFSNIHIENTNHLVFSGKNIIVGYPVPGDYQLSIHMDNCIITQNSSTMFMVAGIDSRITNSLLVSTSLGLEHAFLGVSPARKLTMDKCTLVGYATVMEAFAIVVDSGNSSEYTNNIFYYPNRIASVPIIAPPAGSFIGLAENNLYFTANYESPLSNGTDTNTIFANPLFAETDLYTLSNSSPAIDTGIGGVNIGWDQVTIGVILTPATTVNKIGYYYPNFGQSPSIPLDY